ncbi:MAG: nucleotide exchange factor GrpE [Candidatus Polarisedimenticolia bacterium]
MNDKKKRPEKIDMDDVLGTDVPEAESPEVELLDPATGKAASSAREDSARLREALAEKDRYQDLWTRARADFDNLRKRVEREREEETTRAGAALVRDILPVLDNLERALADPSVTGSVRDGVALIHRQLKDVLVRAGLEPIEALGETFDPVYHEAVVTERTPRFEHNRVLEEIQKGYLYRGRVLRPSLVKVALRPEDGEEGAMQKQEPGG